MINDCNECAVRWSCALEADGPNFVPCPLHSFNVYDPPAGWRYGFPRAYKPLPNESVADTLRRDGYPEKEDPDFAAKHTRFWRKEQ